MLLAERTVVPFLFQYLCGANMNDSAPLHKSYKYQGKRKMAWVSPNIYN